MIWWTLQCLLAFTVCAQCILVSSNASWCEWSVHCAAFLQLRSAFLEKICPGPNIGRVDLSFVQFACSSLWLRVWPRVGRGFRHYAFLSPLVASLAYLASSVGAVLQPSMKTECCVEPRLLARVPLRLLPMLRCLGGLCAIHMVPSLLSWDQELQHRLFRWTWGTRQPVSDPMAVTKNGCDLLWFWVPIGRKSSWKR